MKLSANLGRIRSGLGREESSSVDVSGPGPNVHRRSGTPACQWASAYAALSGIPKGGIGIRTGCQRKQPRCRTLVGREGRFCCR